MRVAVDAHVIGEGETGNETYTVNLLRGLAASPSQDSYQVLTPHPERLRAAIELPENFEVVSVWPGHPVVRIPFAIPAAVRRYRSDVLHVSYVAPPKAACQTVVTVHDLSYLVYPDSVSVRTRIILTTLVPLSVRRAARVIAVSDHTKRDLVARYRLPPDRIAVIYEAASPAFHRLPAGAPQPLPRGVAEPFILAVGNLEPRKNLVRLIDAFAELARDSLTSAQLVIVGRARARAKDVFDSAQANALKSRVVFTGFITDAELNLLYNRAALFVYPSLYEGFGLPPIEAMSCGCPVVASNASALPEVLGDAAILVDPLSVPAIAQAMREVLTSPELARTLADKGLRHAARFSWQKAAAQTREVYADALRQRMPATGA